jgi:hypothetical protein
MNESGLMRNRFTPAIEGSSVRRQLERSTGSSEALWSSMKSGELVDNANHSLMRTKSPLASGAAGALVRPGVTVSRRAQLVVAGFRPTERPGSWGPKLRRSRVTPLVATSSTVPPESGRANPRFRIGPAATLGGEVGSAKTRR